MDKEVFLPIRNNDAMEIDKQCKHKKVRQAAMFSKH